MTKPIALVLTDTHLHEGNIELVTDIWNQAILKCKELKITQIFFAGDFFTSRKGQSLAVDNAGRNIINNVVKSKINLFAIAGNHDKVDLNSKNSYLDEYANRDFVKIYTEYNSLQLSDKLIIHWIPYFKEHDLYPEQLDLAVKNTIRLKKDFEKAYHLLITHVAVSGVRNNDGSQIENHLTGTQFSHFDEVWVGHYHNKSFVEPNVHYIGSAYQSNYGEDVEKGFTVLNDDGSSYFIQSKFKQYIKLKLDITDEKAIKAAEKQYKNSDDNIRFVFEGEEAELKNVNKEKFASLGIEVTFNKDSAVPLDNEGLVEKATSVSFDRQGIDKAFETFCEMKHIEDNSIGLKYLKQI